MAGRKTPQVVDGPRQPVDRMGTDPEQAAKAVAEARAKRPVAAPDGVVVYEAISAKHRVLLSSPLVITDPLTGTKEYRRGLVAAFQDFEFRTKDPVIIEKLDNHRNYGLGKDFWRAEEGRQVALEASIAALTQTVKSVSDPETARRPIAELAPLAGPDFQLPAPQTEAVE